MRVPDAQGFVGKGAFGMNTPGNVLYPESFAEAARAALKGTRTEVEVLDEKALAKGGFGGKGGEEMI